MRLINFSVINKSKASEESIRLAYSPGRGLSSLPLTLVEHYCTNPECPCETAYIEVSRIPAEGPAAVLPGRKTGTETDSETDIPGAPVRLEVNLAGGAVAFPENYQADDRKKEILEQVGDGLTEAHLSTLRRHYKEAKDWGNENNWKEADWSHLMDGILVYWTEVFPLAEPWVFKHENTDYMAEDSYCILPSCDCNDAHIAIHKIHRPPLLSRIPAAMAHLSDRNSPPANLSATIIGVVKYDTKTGRLSVDDVECGRPDQLLRLAGVLFETTKTWPPNCAAATGLCAISDAMSRNKRN